MAPHSQQVALARLQLALCNWNRCSTCSPTTGFTIIVHYISTYCPRDVCSSSVTSVDAPGHVQLLANNAYLSSSSHTTCSANLTCNLFSGLNICTYCGTHGAKSFTAHDLRIVCSSCKKKKQSIILEC